MLYDKILLVDSEKNVILAYQAFLSDAGFNVEIAVHEKETTEKTGGKKKTASKKSKKSE